MSMVASQITGVLTVYSMVCSVADQRKHQSSTSLAFLRGIHQWPMNSPHKGPVTRKMFPFDDIIMNKDFSCYPPLWTFMLTTDVLINMITAFSKIFINIHNWVYFCAGYICLKAYQMLQVCHFHIICIAMQCGKLNFWSTHVETDVPYMFYIKFHLPSSIFYLPYSKFTHTGECASIFVSITVVYVSWCHSIRGDLN